MANALVLLSFGIASFIGTSLSSSIRVTFGKTGLSRRAVNTGCECVGADVGK